MRANAPTHSASDIRALEHRVANLETLRYQLAALKATIASMQGTSARLAAN